LRKDVVVRSLSLLFLVLFVAYSAVAQTGAANYKGRTVVSVIDEFRSQEWPFAYSTNLVNDSLLVTIEPQAENPPEILNEILAPHGLAVRAEEGFYLIVRAEAPLATVGNLLIVVRDRGRSAPINQVGFHATPELVSGIVLSPGVTQFEGILAGKYLVTTEAAGFELSLREITVEAGETVVLQVHLQPEQPVIEAITVSASRYEIARDISNSRFNIDQNAIENLPDVADDPIRATHRLPGAAASGVSARAHFRGGEESEIGIILNGKRLLDPFHVRDYQNIFSTVDSRAIEGVEVYTGGFPVQYGDRLSGVVLMESMESPRPRHTEIGLSVFNTSLLTSGLSADGNKEWLFSARRGNLDLVLDTRLGEPRYHDLFGEYSVWLTPNARLSASALFADDKVTIILEDQVDEREESTSDTENAQFWLTLDNHWSETLSSTTVFSASQFQNARVGFTEDEEKVVSDVDDRRDITIIGFRQDWIWRSSDSHLLQWGFAVDQNDATYLYKAEAEYFGLKGIFEGVPTDISRDLAATPTGTSFSFYASDKWKINAGTILELGLRWDDQTYTDLNADSQLSPRVSLLQVVGPKTDVRLSWGRYYQSQGIQELQIEDGVTTFFPAQRADHFIAGVNHRINDEMTVRFELFYKDMSSLRPRYENLYDKLALIPEVQPDRIRIAPDSARARGLEFSLNRSGESFNWWANYSLTRVTDTIDGEEFPRSWDQRHALQFGMNWQADEWNFAIAANVRSGWPTTDLQLEEIFIPGTGFETVAVPGVRNAEQLPYFASLDARVSRTFDVRMGGLTVFAEVSNLLDRNNLCCLDYDLETDENGNDFLASSPDYLLPLLPAVGILWEF
jgi:outer membrane receptor protein involved in Fe transport